MIEEKFGFNPRTKEICGALIGEDYTVKFESAWETKKHFEEFGHLLEKYSIPVTLIIKKENTSEYKKSFNFITELEDHNDALVINTCKTFNQFSSMDELEQFIHNVQITNDRTAIDKFQHFEVIECAYCDECGKSPPQHFK